MLRNLKLKCFFSWILILGSPLVISGCATLFSDQVIERSRESRPSWATEATIQGQFSKYEEQFTVVLSQDGILNFPIGAKESQTRSLDMSSELLVEYVRQKWMSFAESKQLPITSEADLRELTKRRAQEFHGLYASVSDLYFEKRLSRADAGVKEVYFVQVRIDFASQGMLLLDQKLLEDFKKSNQPDLIQLAGFYADSKLSH